MEEETGRSAHSSLGLPQYSTERILSDHLGRLGFEVGRGVALTGLSQNGADVATRLLGSDHRTEAVSFKYVVGCDGVRTGRRSRRRAPPSTGFPDVAQLRRCRSGVTTASRRSGVHDGFLSFQPSSTRSPARSMVKFTGRRQMWP